MSKSLRATIEQVLAGDTEQYREIVRAFEADVFRVAAPALGSRSAAEDLTQEVFIVAYRRLESFDLSESFRPWLLGIASNLVRNELRRGKRERKRMELYSLYFDAITSEEHPVGQFEEKTEALAKCREKLTSTAAAAIDARYEEGMPLETLATRLKRSVTATRQLLYRTRLALRDCIESHLASQGGDA